MTSTNYEQISRSGSNGVSDETSDRVVKLLRKCFNNTLGTFRVPILEWLPHYTKKDLEGDINAGIVVFILLIPQGMAYAVLAGVPAIYGLYCAVVPLYTYSIFGTSRQLSIAAFAIMSLLVGALLQDLGYEAESDEYIGAAMSLSLMSGIVSCAMGFLQLGTMTNFISQTVINGFINASALIVMINQLKYLFGISTPSFDYTFQIVWHIVLHIGETNWATVIISVTTFSFLYYCKTWKAENKNPSKEKFAADPLLRYKLIGANGSGLIAVVVSAVMAYLFIQSDIDVDIVGDVPAGMEAPKVPPLDDIGSLIPASFIIAIMGFLSNWAIASKFAAMHGYDVQASQELIAVGLSNIMGSFFNAFPVAGGLSRSAANNDAGARTTMSGIITATLMLIALFALTSTFYYIPKSVLGTIIMASVISMLDIDIFKDALAKSPSDFVVLIGTFLLTLGLGITIGLMGGVVISICIFLFNNAFPHVAVLGVLEEESDELDSLSQGNDSITLPSPLKKNHCGFSKLMDANAGVAPTSEHMKLAASLMTILYDDVAASENIEITPTPCMNQFVANLSKISFRDVSLCNVRFIRGISIVRMEASLMFANSAQFKTTIRLLALGRHVEVGQGEKPMKYLPFYKNSVFDVESGPNENANNMLVSAGGGSGDEESLDGDARPSGGLHNHNHNPKGKGPLKLIIIDVSSWRDVDLVGMGLLKELQADLMKQPPVAQDAAKINPLKYVNGVLLAFVYAHRNSNTYNKIILSDLKFEVDPNDLTKSIVYDTIEEVISDFPRRWTQFSEGVLKKKIENDKKNVGAPDQLKETELEAIGANKN